MFLSLMLKPSSDKFLLSVLNKIQVAMMIKIMLENGNVVLGKNFSTTPVRNIAAANNAIASRYLVIVGCLFINPLMIRASIALGDEDCVTTSLEYAPSF